MQYQLKLKEEDHSLLEKHLFPGDGKEAVAVALCGRGNSGDRTILTAHRITLIPYNECERYDDFIRWKTDLIHPLIEEASKKDMAILKIHSHPGGYNKFSDVDDKSDNELFDSVFGWCDSDEVHASAVMLPNGKIFGRVFNPDLTCKDIDRVSVIGNTIRFFDKVQLNLSDAFGIRTLQAFGKGTYQIMKSLKVGVIGASGTGSPTIEQLYRLGIGELVLIDPDIVEQKNLNRIINSRLYQAEQGELKVEIIKEAIDATGLGTNVKVYPVNLYDSIEAIKELSTCDILFGCVDSIDGRHLVGQISNFYLIPYFDMGVRLVADGKGGIEKIVGSVNFLQPGKSSLLTRKLYTPELLGAASLLRANPDEYNERKKEGYIANINVENPAVISINMQISAMAVNEFLNRIHKFKDEPEAEYAKITMDFSDGSICNESENSFEVDLLNQKWSGRGDCSPFLRMPEL